ncbi:hypothetical protein TVAG_261060 [Trichomonas vaginalis G3]|uniref:aspartyl aminopeptidase n=1 Tax=Trichomonas vaginalis (strain ATCC PRA-98 / G3) TaxID=412133 RepID=A2FPR6_TRIV3|nr:aminopeptidase protein [Trichomonas vaginalis G3]EAX93096.1 hypothetical protein TVAG_261060 [Trichomonas vaginalis G3]KAI5516613.1 aminopeptidase protein [Trichomonas vaginalis G3]|eukprot:XP_001306026.1 hypothetical protein [Trichomonas vaginalis G3]
MSETIPETTETNQPTNQAQNKAPAKGIEDPTINEKANQFMNFVYDSPTSLHCRENIINILKKSGYTELEETSSWGEIPNKFYVKRGFGNLIAVDKNDLSKATIVLAKSDYPCFKVSQNSYRQSALCEQLRTDPVGNGLWFSWTDRDLRIAGQAQIKDEEGKLLTKNFKSDVPVAVIPSLAIHLASGSGVKPVFKLNQHFFPIVALSKGKSRKNTEQSPVLMAFIAQLCNTNPENIQSFDVYLSDYERPEKVGIEEEFVVGQGIVGPGTAYSAFQGFISSESPSKGMKVFTLLEESSFKSDFLSSTLKRIGVPPSFYQISFLVTVSGLPGVHPNFSKDTDGSNTIGLGKGIMYNWSGDMNTASIVSGIAKLLNIASKADKIINKNISTSKNDSLAVDLTAKVGIPSVEISLPVLGVGSIREMIHKNDIPTLIDFVRCIYHFNV